MRVSKLCAPPRPLKVVSSVKLPLDLEPSIEWEVYVLCHCTPPVEFDSLGSTAEQVIVHTYESFYDRLSRGQDSKDEAEIIVVAGDASTWEPGSPVVASWKWAIETIGSS